MCAASKSRTANRGSTAATGRMILLGLRTGWVGLLGVAGSAALLVTAVAAGVEALYADATDRAQYAATIGVSPATQALNGLGYGLSTTGGLTVYEVGFMGQLLFPMPALYVALRHTRREEEAGRIELLTAARTGRLAPIAAATVLLALTALATGVLMLLGMVSAGLPLAGSSWYSAGVTALMLFFGALGLLLGQLCQSTRSGYLLGLTVITGAYLVRAVVDGLGWDAAWASPLGWMNEIRAFAEPQGWPLGTYTVGALVLLTIAALVAGRRDLGAGVIAPGRGRPRARRSLGTVAGAAWRLTRPVVLAWTVLAVLWAGCFGLLAQEMATLVDDNPTLLEALGVERGSDVVISAAVVVISLAATAVAVQGSGRLGAEESSDRLGAMLATRVSRSRLWLAWWGVVAVSSLAILALATAALGLTSWASTGDRAALATALEVGVGYAVPVLFVSAVAALLRAGLPRFAPLAWALVGWIVLVGFLAETLRIPGWGRDLSPLHLVGTLPQEDPSILAIAGLAVAAVVIFAVSATVFRQRNLRAGHASA